MVGEFAGYAAAILVFAAVLEAVVIQVCRYRAVGAVPYRKAGPYPSYRPMCRRYRIWRLSITGSCGRAVG